LTLVARGRGSKGPGGLLAIRSTPRLRISPKGDHTWPGSTTRRSGDASPKRRRLVGMGDDRLEDLRTRLDDIAEELADIGLAKLKEAVREDNTLAAAQERRLARARRAVMRAAALLAGGEDEEGPD
jgi:hypothetical protein